MKFNKWTLGLAALGVVSLAAAARADEKVNFAQTALTGTTISGYVDTSMQWNFGTGNLRNPPYSFNSAQKADGFNLNVVQLTISKPLDESEWAAGYHVDLWMGPDANSLNTSSYGFTFQDFAIRQAYVNLRTPIGNGIEWKIGVIDTLVSYESLESGNNPNFTRSYGFAMEPTTHTGVMGSYRINDAVSVQAGIANTTIANINSRAFLAGTSSKAESFKTYMGSIALTAPKDWGWAAGSTLYAGVINGFGGTVDEAANQTDVYVGATMATPVTGVKVGAAFDYKDVHDFRKVEGNTGMNGGTWAAGLYTTWQATEKLSLNLRGEYVDDRSESLIDGDNFNNTGVQLAEVTVTAQYDLWKNVVSRLEFRWDHGCNGSYFGFNSNSSSNFGAPTRRNAEMLAANIIYKF